MHQQPSTISHMANNSTILLESAWAKTLKQPLSAEEALLVWETSASSLDDGWVQLMAAVLDEECGRGERCQVCGCHNLTGCTAGHHTTNTA